MAEKTAPLSTVDLAEENDVDSSFVTAHTSTIDAVHSNERSEIQKMSPVKEDKKQLRSSRPNFDEPVAHRPNEPTRPLQTPLLPIGEENSRVERHGPIDTPPGMISKISPVMQSVSNAGGTDTRKPPLLALHTGFESPDASATPHDAAANGYPQTPTNIGNHSGAATETKTSRPQTAPMSAPPNLGSSKIDPALSKSKCAEL